MEVRLFFRSTQQVVFTFCLPVLFLVIFSAVFSGDIETPDGRRLAFRTYFLPGIIASGVMSTTFANLALSISAEQHRGLLKRLAGTPLPKTAFFAGRVTESILITAIQTALMLVIGRAGYGIGLPPDLGRWFIFVLMLALSAAVGAALGIAYTRVIRNENAGPPAVQLPFLTLQFISGVYFRFADVPGWLQAIASVFPLRWTAEGLRYAFLPDWFGKAEYGGSWGWQMPVVMLTIWLAVACGLALRFFRWDRQPEP